MHNRAMVRRVQFRDNLIEWMQRFAEANKLARFSRILQLRKSPKRLTRKTA